MKLPCAVIRDLLPMYAEKMVSPETEKLIEEHLALCPQCRQALPEKAQPLPPVPSSAQPLLTLKKELRKRRWTAAVLAALIVFTALFTFFYRSNQMRRVPWEKGLIRVDGVEERPLEYLPEGAAAEGQTAETEPALVVHVSKAINGIQEEHITDDNGKRIVILEGWTSNPPFSQGPSDYSAEWVFQPVPDQLLYDDGSHQELLWGEPMDGGVKVLPRLALGWYGLISGALMAVLGALWFFMRRLSCQGLLRQLFFAPTAYLMAQLLLKGSQTVTFFLQHDLLMILVLASALYALLTLGWKMAVQRKQEA